MKNKTGKTIINDQRRISVNWTEKFLLELFGDMCNLVGQAHQGRKISAMEMKGLVEIMFDLAMDFTKRAKERSIEEENNN